MLCQYEYLQYAQKPMVDPRSLGRWFSWLFFCNPNHMTRIVVAYRPCASELEGLNIVYQQHLRCIQSRGLPFNPVDLFHHNPSKQIKEWRGKGERIILMMGINDHPALHKAEVTKHQNGGVYTQMPGPKRAVYAPLRKITN
jgi:hypothetical protein